MMNQIDSYENLPDDELNSPMNYAEAEHVVDLGSQKPGITSLSSTFSRSTPLPSTPSDLSSQKHSISPPPSPSTTSTQPLTVPSVKPSLPEPDPQPKRNSTPWQTSSKKERPHLLFFQKKTLQTSRMIIHFVHYGHRHGHCCSND